PPPPPPPPPPPMGAGGAPSGGVTVGEALNYGWAKFKQYAGPLIVIIAGLFTAWLAVKSSDGLVTEDYYKQGQAAGETLARSQRAETLGLTAALRVTERNLFLRLSARDAAFTPPQALRVTVSHPTRAGLDQTTRLVFDGERYTGDFLLPSSGHWLVLIEDEANTWRLMGSVLWPAAGEAIIGGMAGKPADQ
ncbi:MAG: FixH family protein, partial [Rhodocyclaceae bacterium]|nr:FixH family protein [Rhodocyclaceae bacterium]